MQQLTISALLTLTLILVGQDSRAREACPPQPPWTAPTIPDGSTATLDDMARAQNAVQAYVSAIEHWNNCNDFILGLQSGRMLQRAQQTADNYNAQLRAFRLKEARQAAR